MVTSGSIIWKVDLSRIFGNHVTDFRNQLQMWRIFGIQPPNGHIWFYNLRGWFVTDFRKPCPNATDFRNPTPNVTDFRNPTPNVTDFLNATPNVTDFRNPTPNVTNFRNPTPKWASLIIPKQRYRLQTKWPTQRSQLHCALELLELNTHLNLFVRIRLFYLGFSLSGSHRVSHFLFVQNFKA